MAIFTNRLEKKLDYKTSIFSSLAINVIFIDWQLIAKGSLT